MKPSIQQKIGEFKRLSANGKIQAGTTLKSKAKDSLSTAIHSRKDAENFIAEVKSARKC